MERVLRMAGAPGRRLAGAAANARPPRMDCMKIAIVSTPFISVPPKDYGGTELVIAGLVDGLVAGGHEVTLFATGDSRTAACLEAFYREAVWPPDTLTELNHMSWALARVGSGGFDVVHCHAPTALALARLIPDTPLVYTLHHAREEALSRFYAFYPWVWFVAISERQRRCEVSLPRMDTIYHGLDPAGYAGPTRAGDYVCFIGRLSEVKGPQTAIDVAEQAGLEIRVAGRFHEVDEKTDFAAREVEPRLARPHVRYQGAVGPEEKAAMLRGARALLLPLAWEEPFGLVMVEAMLAGCPVVAFPRGSAPELVEPGVTGYLVSDAAAMVEVLGTRLHDFDRERCRARAAERFGRDAMVAAYEVCYRRARSGGGRQASRSMVASA